MISLGELRLEAQLENVRVIAHLLDGIGNRLELTEKMLFDMQLAVEEATVNIVHHAYPGEEKGDMFIDIAQVDDTLEIKLMDWGVPFDPKNIKPFNIDAPIETRIKGGMGLHLIYNLMDGVERYVQRDFDNANVLALKKKIERIPAGLHKASATRELNAILNVSQIMTTKIDLDDLLTRIVDELVKAIEAERGTLYLIDHETDELVSRVLMEDSSKLTEIRIGMGEGIAGQVAQTGHVLRIKNVYENPHFFPDFDRITGFHSETILAAPMRNPKEDIIGVVQLINKRGGLFTSRDERLLTAMASQAAISIENARLYQQEIEQRLIHQELETARTIQMSFLPQVVPQHANWDAAFFWLPMRDVGGDFYDFYRLPDGRWACVIADVSGKGVPAAMFMAFNVTVLRFAMDLGFSPSALMKRANQFMIANQKSKMFATVFVMYVDLETGQIEYASAGHNPPMLYRAATRSIEYLEVDGVAMGLFPDAEYAESVFTMQPGDVLVLYTDGITEVINEEDEEFGEEHLQKLIFENASQDCVTLSDLITSAVSAFSVDARGFDDETLIVIKRK